MKKSMKIGIGLVATAGVATAISVPLALRVGEKEDVIKHIDMSQEAWHGLTLQQLVDGVKKEEQQNGSLMTSVTKSAAFYLYDREQEGSIKLQKQYFEYQKWDLDQEKTTTTPTPARITEIDKEIKKIDEKITKIDKLTVNDYKDSNFSSDYPHILMLRSIIRERQDNILADSRNAFVSQFATKPEGERAWVNERHTKYNGATSDKQAAGMLVYQIIEKDALSSTRYEVNSSFTVKQKRSQKFSFLTNAVSKSTNVNDTDKVYFISTQSNIPDKKFVDVSATNAQIMGMASAKLIQTSHALIPAIQNEKGASLPWKVTKEMLIGKEGSGGHFGLLEKYGTGNNRFYELLTDLFKDAAKNGGISDGDKLFIEHATGQPSAAKDGSLGVNYKIDSLESMVPGFVLGSIEGMTHAGDSDTDGKTVIKAITDGIAAWFTANRTLTTNEKLKEKINSMTDEQVTNTFGTIFRDAFDDLTILKSSLPKLTYRLDTNSYIVVSKFGIHLVYNKDFSVPKTLSDQITADLQRAADDQSTSHVIIDYAKLFGKTSTPEKVIGNLMNDADFNTYLEAGYNKAEDTKEVQDMQEIKKDDGSHMPFADVKTEIDKSIKNTEATRTYQVVKKVLGTTLDSYLIPQYDKKLRDASVSATQIYADAIALGGTK